MPRAKRRCSKDCKNYQPCPLPGHSRTWGVSKNPLPSNWKTLVRRAKAANVRRYGTLKCVDCLQPQTAVEVDHIVPRADGGKNVLSNLRCLCKACHKKRTYRRGKDKS